MSFDFDSEKLTPEGNFEAGSAIKAEDLNLLLQEIIDVYQNFGGITYYTTALGYIPIVDSQDFVFSPFWGTTSKGKGGVIWANCVVNNFPLWDLTSLQMELTTYTNESDTITSTTQKTILLPYQPEKILWSDTNTTNTHILGKITRCSQSPTIGSICFQENNT